MFSSWRIVLRRALADRLMLTAAAVTILLAVTVLAASPIYADSVTLASLHRILQDGDSGASLEVAALSDPSNFEDFDRIVRREADASFSGTGAEVTAKLVGTSVLLDIVSEDDRFPLGSIQYLEGIEQRATLTGGVWPSNGSEPYEIALLTQTASLLEVEVGDPLTLISRRDSSETEVTVVGIFTVDDHSDLFWHGDELAQAGVTETDTFRTFGPLVAAREVVLGPMTHSTLDMMWRVFPDHDALTVAAIPDQRRAVTGFETRLNAAVGERVSEFSVETGLDGILTEAEQSVVATRSSVLMLSLQLAILAGYALMHTAGLLVDSRTVETGLLRARGAGNGQIITVAAMEGVLLTLPAILLAPPLAALLLRLLTVVGPLAAIGLEFEPRVTSTAYTLSIIAALACIAALAIPAYRSARTFNDSLVARSRQETRSFAQRAGWDVALIVLAGAGFWQLSSYGVQLSSTLRDRWGIDPLLVAVPALGMLGGAVLALRFVPLMAGLLERLTGRSKRTVSALSSWQISRRPQRYSRAALLLIIAVSVGFFVSAYADTWTQSQRDQAAFINGADIRAVPLRTSGSLSDLNVRQGHQAIEGVVESMPVTLSSGQMIRSGPVTRYFALDAAVAAGILSLREDQIGGDFPAMMEMLVDSRPEVVTVDLPGEPQVLIADIGFDSPDPCGRIFDRWAELGVESGERYIENPHCLAPVVSVIIQDDHGMMYRVVLGEVPVNEGVTSLSVTLVGDLNGDPILPAYPLGVVAVEVRTPMPGDLAWEQEADITLSLYTSENLDGSAREQVVLTDGDLDTSRSLPGNVPGTRIPPFMLATGSGGNWEASMSTGAAVGFPLGAPIHFSIRPPGSDTVPALPLVVTEGLLDRTGVIVDTTLDLGRFNTITGIGRIAGTIGLFPTIDQGIQEAVVFDLPTLQVASYVPGARIDLPTEYWLDVDEGDSDQVVAALGNPPFGSLRIRSQADATSALVSDPMALSTIAALSLGFVAALVFAVIGFTVNIIVLARERQTEFTLLRALGLSVRQLRSWLALEQAAVVVAGLALGTLIGLILSSIVLPLISVTQAGAIPVPEPEVIIPVLTIVGLNLFVMVVLAVIIAVLAYAARRRDIASQLRMGEN